MRTTLALDDDVISAARAIAERDRRTIGEVVSEMARRGMQPSPSPPKLRNGIPQFQRPKGAKVVVTMETVNALRDDED